MQQGKYNLTNTIRKLFSEKEILTLKQLYGLLSEQMTNSGDEAKFKHRVRAIIFSLYKNKELEHVEKGKWKKA